MALGPVWADALDVGFYKRLTEGVIAATDLAKLAQQRSTDLRIKELADGVVLDYSTQKLKLQNLALANHVSLPRTASPAQLEAKADVERLTGKSFDNSYIRAQIKVHTDTVNLLQKEINSGQDKDAKEFASSLLPTNSRYLAEFHSIAAAERVEP
jgi:putative membrane protein